MTLHSHIRPIISQVSLFNSAHVQLQDGKCHGQLIGQQWQLSFEFGLNSLVLNSTMSLYKSRKCSLQDNVAKSRDMPYRGDGSIEHNLVSVESGISFLDSKCVCKSAKRSKFNYHRHTDERTVGAT